MKHAGASLVRDTRGAVFVESLIGYVPVVWFFFVLWQLFELMAADLVVRRAASAAARAASVVLSDDPHFYGGPGAQAGNMDADIKYAAELIVRAAPQLKVQSVTHATGAAPKGNKHGKVVSATVSAEFKCAGGWMTVVCAGNSRTIQRTATQAYHWADYSYD